MLPKFDVQFNVINLSVYRELRYGASSCYEVLLSGLEGKSYLGDFRDLASTGSAAAAIEHAYVKILRLLDHVCALRTHCNSLAPISRLHPDVLLRIFAFCTYRHNGGAFGTITPHALAFSQVCSSWRRLALADPSLWTDVDFRRQKLIELKISRAHPIPVSIVSEGLPYRELLPHPLRVRSFTVVIPQHRDIAWYESTHVPRYLSDYFPSLDTIRLSNRQRYIQNISDLRQLNAPRLKHLELENWTLHDWTGSFAANLTYLRLTVQVPDEGISLEHHVRHTLASIFHVLRTCNRLTSLVLEGALGGDVEYTNEPLQEVRLDYLQDLTLSEGCDTLGHVLPYLSLPRLQSLRLETRSAPSLEQMRRLCVAVDHCLAIARWTDLSYKAARLSSTSLHVKGYTGAGGPDQACTHSMIIQWGSGHTWDVWTMLNSSLPSVMSQMASLILDLFPHLLDVWASISLIPSLTNLGINFHHIWNEIHINSLAQVLQVLYPDSVSLSEASDDPFEEPFPALRTITIYALEVQPAVNGVSPFSRLVVFLNHRHNKGRPVYVTLDNCSQDTGDEARAQRTQYIRVVGEDTEHSCTTPTVSEIRDWDSRHHY